MQEYFYKLYNELEEIKEIEIENQEYLVKWKEQSYLLSTWELKDQIEDEIKITDFNERNLVVPIRKLKKECIRQKQKFRPLKFKCDGVNSFGSVS